MVGKQDRSSDYADKQAAHAADILHVRELFGRSIELKQRALETLPGKIADAAKACADSIESGGKLLLCGNGGSAADAQHLAAELLVRLRPDVNRRGLPALALALDSSTITACGNDYGYESLFERMVNALGRENDALITITTSGRSPNVVLALKAARSIGVTTIGLLGSGGGVAAALCDIPIIVPSNETGRIQEVHITAGHALMELIENDLLSRGYIQAEDSSKT